VGDGKIQQQRLPLFESRDGPVGCHGVGNDTAGVTAAGAWARSLLWPCCRRRAADATIMWATAS